MTRPEYGTEDYRRYAALFNDVTRAPASGYVGFSDRGAIADYLWEQGWRREVRAEDVTESRRLCAPLPLGEELPAMCTGEQDCPATDAHMLCCQSPDRRPHPPPVDRPPLPNPVIPSN